MALLVSFLKALRFLPWKDPLVLSRFKVWFSHFLDLKNLCATLDVSLRATAETFPLPAGPRISPFSSAISNQRKSRKIISQKKCRWILTPWYSFRLGMISETRWKVASHLLQLRRYKRYAAPLLSFAASKKSPCVPWHLWIFPSRNHQQDINDL